MARESASRDWNRHQWAGDEIPDDEAQVPEIHWNKFEWVAGSERRRDAGTPDPRQMAEGEHGLSGFRHNPGVQHWVAHNGR